MRRLRRSGRRSSFTDGKKDWSVLADPALRTEPFDSLKYIPLSPSDPKSYVSLGATLRERYEFNNGESFGTGHTPTDAYLIQRLWLHADIHLNENWQIFTQLEDARAFDKNVITPADQNRLDLRLAFLAYTNTIGGRHLQGPGRPAGFQLRPPALRLLARRSQRAAIVRRGLGGLGDRRVAFHRLR